MSLWLVRGGRHGEQERGVLESNVVTIAWNELPDLSNVRSKEELRELYIGANPTAKKARALNHVGQIWRFVREIQRGDLVALPVKAQSALAIGEVEGDYEYQELTNNVRHTRRVKWLKVIPRSTFDLDIIHSLGSIMTVCKIERNDAENRVRLLLRTGGN